MKNSLQSSIIFKSMIASADQAMLSAINFLISIILIKVVSRVEYGYYSIAFTIILFVISIQDAIINTPLAVLLAKKRSNNKKQYVGSLCYGQYIIVLPIGCVCLAISLLLKFRGFDPKLIAVIISICFAIIGILLREFIRSFYFADQRSLKVLKVDALYVTLFIIFGAIIFLLFKISVDKIFLASGVSALLVGMFFARSFSCQFRLKYVKESYSENWKFGKWALGGVVVTHLQNYCYLYLLGALIGSSAVAEVSAARLLLMPMVLIQTGWYRIVIPYGARLREQGKLGFFFKQLVTINILIVFGVGIYVALLMLFSESLQRYLLGEKYANSFNYLILWGIVFAMGFIVNNASSGLLVIKKFHVITKANFLTMLVTICCAYFLIKSYGIKGGLTALIIGSTILSVMLWCYLKKFINLEKADLGMRRQIRSFKTASTAR